jgi:hypothetical protein
MPPAVVLCFSRSCPLPLAVPRPAPQCCLVLLPRSPSTAPPRPRAPGSPPSAPARRRAAALSCPATRFQAPASAAAALSRIPARARPCVCPSGRASCARVPAYGSVAPLLARCARADAPGLARLLPGDNSGWLMPPSQRTPNTGGTHLNTDRHVQQNKATTRRLKTKTKMLASEKKPRPQGITNRTEHKISKTQQNKTKSGRAQSRAPRVRSCALRAGSDGSVPSRNVAALRRSMQRAPQLGRCRRGARCRPIAQPPRVLPTPAIIRHRRGPRPHAIASPPLCAHQRGPVRRGRGPRQRSSGHNKPNRNGVTLDTVVALPL